MSAAKLQEPHVARIQLTSQRLSLRGARRGAKREGEAQAPYRAYGVAPAIRRQPGGEVAECSEAGGLPANRMRHPTRCAVARERELAARALLLLLLLL